MSDSAHGNQQEPSGRTSGDWYAVDERGDSALRITPGFVIGETATGSLALNDRHPEQQWLEFHVDDRNILWVDIIAPGRALRTEEGLTRQRQPLDDGARLALPHNTLHVSRDITIPPRNGPSFEIVVREAHVEDEANEPDRTTLAERLNAMNPPEPVQESEQPDEPASPEPSGAAEPLRATPPPPAPPRRQPTDQHPPRPDRQRSGVSRRLEPERREDDELVTIRSKGTMRSPANPALGEDPDPGRTPGSDATPEPDTAGRKSEDAPRATEARASAASGASDDDTRDAPGSSRAPQPSAAEPKDGQDDDPTQDAGSTNDASTDRSRRPPMLDVIADLREQLGIHGPQPRPPGPGGLVGGEPSADKEPSAHKEPSADKEPSARVEPSPGVAPSAYREPSARVEPSAHREPSPRQEPPAQQEPSTRRQPFAGRRLRPQAASVPDDDATVPQDNARSDAGARPGAAPGHVAAGHHALHAYEETSFAGAAEPQAPSSLPPEHQRPRGGIPRPDPVGPPPPPQEPVPGESLVERARRQVIERRQSTPGAEHLRHEPPPRQYRSQRRPRSRSLTGPALVGAGVLVLAAAMVLRGPELVTAIDQRLSSLTDDAEADLAPATPAADTAFPEGRSVAATPDAAGPPATPAPASGDRAGSTVDTLEVRAQAPAATDSPAAGSLAATRTGDGRTAADPNLANEDVLAGTAPSDPAGTDTSSAANRYDSPASPYRDPAEDAVATSTAPSTARAPVTGNPSAQAPTSGPAEVDTSAPDAAPAIGGRTGSASAGPSPFTGRLALARQLISEGEITTPPGSNAVSVLTGILEQSPEHPAARALLEDCSDHLIASAVQYHQAGREYEARNTLEEVLSFAPSHTEANRLWRTWVGTPP